MAMKCTIRDINNLVENVRAGQPPELPEGKSEEHYHDPAMRGVYIRVLDTGVASWTVQWKRLGQQKKITIGDVKVLDRPVAIEAAKDLLAKIQLEVLDPHEARRERMRANKVKFAKVVPLFLEDKKRRGELKPRTEQGWKIYLTGYYFKPLHSLPIDEITKEQIQTQIKIIAGQSGNRTAGACRAAMNVFFKWAIKSGELPDSHHNPVANVQAPPANDSRDRVLDDAEIRQILKECVDWEAEAIREKQFKDTTGNWPRKGAPHNINHSRIVWLLFLTGCRVQEIGGLRRSEIDLDNAELLIPGWRRKARKKHEKALELCNPLASGAVQIFRNVEQELRPDDTAFFLGPSPRRKKETSRFKALDNTVKSINRRIIKAGGTPPPHWTLHDIRRTFRTRLAQLGVTPDVSERLLGHISHRTEMDRTYNRYNYWPEKRQALAKWEAHLRAVIDGTAEKIAYPRFGQKGAAP